ATGNGDSASETLAPSTADVLGPLKSVLGVHTDELTLMAMLDEKEPDLPVAIPRCAEEARVQVERLRRLNEVVLTVCRFTDREVSVVSERRRYCEEPAAGRTLSNVALYMWAFAHVVEALTFNSVLTYATVDPPGQQINLELRVERVRSLDTTTPETLATFMA